MELVPTTWPKASEFIQALVGPKCLDLHLKTPFLGSMVIQMQTPDIREVFTDKLATLKVDGERHILFMYVEGDVVRTFVMRRNGQILDAPSGICTKRPGSPIRTGFFTILDCEYVVERNMWLAFDCIVYRSIPQTIQQDFLKRHELLLKALTVDFLCERIVAKPFFPIEPGRPRFSEWVLEETVRALGFPVQHDGIVFQPKHGPYPVGANMNLTSGRGLKWKPDCTLDLVPRELFSHDVEQIYGRLFGKASVAPRGQLIRTTRFYGTTKGWKAALSGTKTMQTFQLPQRLFRLECVSDFTTDFTTVELNKLPLCCNGSYDKNVVVEFEFQGDCVPVERCIRTDKAPQQANKARTVAGVLWQADHNQTTHKGLDDFLLHPEELPPTIVIEPPSGLFPVGNPDGKIPLDDFVRGLVFAGGSSAGAGGDDGRSSDVVEHEFKVIQTRRPRPGNIFPSELEPNFLATSFVDVLHFDRVLHGIAKKYGKTVPPKVVTVDFIMDDNLRLTAYERKVPTKSGAPLVFFETRGFLATRKAPTESESKIVDMPDVLRKSGYCYRMDSRTETPELFADIAYVSENEAHRTFLEGLKAMAASGGKKRKSGVAAKFDPNAFKGFRFVDRHEFAKERDVSVPKTRIRRTSLEPIRVGEVVNVEYKGRPGQFHIATVLKVDPDGTVDIEYDYAVRAMTNYASHDYIPIVLDGNGGNGKTVLRIKHRYTFDFPGFKLELTRTKQIYNFKSTPHVRLHRVAEHAPNCEIEVELLSSIQRVPEYVAQLKDVLANVFSCMGLDENAFLFEKVLTPATSPALQEAFDAIRKSRGVNTMPDGVHPVFQRATEGLSRVVIESDFFSNLDDEVRALLPPPMAVDPALATRIRWDTLPLSKWADRSTWAMEDCERRRVLDAIKNAGEEVSDMHGLARGALGVAYDPAWIDEAFWKKLVARIRASAIGSVEDEGAVEIERYLRNPGTSLDESKLHVASPAAIAFGTMVARALYLTEPRAWWDPQEFALAWNDLLDFANKFATTFYKSCIDPREFISAIGVVDAKVYADFLLALVKLSVLVGAVKVVRDICEPSELPDGILTPQLAAILDGAIQERCVYAPRGVKPVEFDFSYVQGVVPRWM
jgi:hypothetical protein